MRVQIIPDYSLDNKKLLGLLENTHYYKTPYKRLKITQDKENISIDYKKNNNLVYEIHLTKDNCNFYLEFPDQLKDNVLTELNICYPKATVKEENKPNITLGATKQLELQEHHFLSLKCDMKGEYPLSNILESQNILKENENILIRLELEPCSTTWYKTQEECIKTFNTKNKVTTKSTFNSKHIVYTAMNTVLDTCYFAIDFFNEIISDEKIEHEYIGNDVYSKLLRNGLSMNTLNKSKYNAYKTNIYITIGSHREDILFRNILKSFNSMAGDNRFIIKDKSNYKNILCSKELSQIMQLPTKYYQGNYNINNIDNREIEVAKELLEGDIPIGTTTYKGTTKNIFFPNSKNVLALPKVIIGSMGSGKSKYTKNFAISAAKKGDSVIVFDYIKDCELTEEISEALDNNVIKIDLSNQKNLFALAYPEMQVEEGMDTWERLTVANILSRQTEYLINSLVEEPLSERMSRYLDAACKVAYIHPGAKINDVINILTNWKIRNEYIREAKYSECFTEEDTEIVDLLELHERNNKGTITGTRENKIEGILDRLTKLRKDIYLRAMLKADINYEHNFVEWIDQGKVILIQLPQHTFTNKQVKDTIVTYFMSRVWLAALQRNNCDRICHVLTDEIHQVPTSAALVSEVITEARKFGIDFYFTIHYLKQFKKLHDAVTSAGCSYMLLAGTEKQNFKALEEEIKPFEITEGLNLKQWHSLNIISYGNQYCKFISRLPKVI